MAVRLSVVMIHSPPPSSSAGQMAEAIVGELIGLPQIDLTLVGRLDQIADGSTDRLTLESLTGDVAVLDWRSPEELVQSLAALGFTGRRAPHTDDPEAPTTDPSERRIYAFDLNRYRDAKVISESVLQLKSSRQVRTFSLAPGPMPARASGAPTSTEPSGETGPAKPSWSPPEPEASPQEAKAGDAKAETHADSIGTGAESSLDLDDLLNRLDELDP